MVTAFSTVGLQHSPQLRFVILLNWGLFRTALSSYNFWLNLTRSMILLGALG